MICGTLLTALLATASFGQGVGINTTTPDPSAALDVQATDKGILIPRVSLQSVSDNTTVPTPATGLLVYNLNPEVPGGTGFFYNIGTAQSPDWTSLRELRLPVNASTSTNSGGTAFRINNFSQSGSAETIHAFSQAGYAFVADGKVKISGNGQQPGPGKVLTSDASGNATWEGGAAFTVIGLKTGGPEVLAKNTLYRVPFDLEKHDTQNNYTPYPESTFQAQASGIYHFDVKIVFETNEDARVQIHHVSGNNESVIMMEDAVGGFLDSFDVKLFAGDKIFVNIIHNNNSNLNLVSASSHFSGHFVQK
ncbi:hypothetical protein ASG33_19705 [Dyadobacter sp. Leaf189]|nr:hypothetical protein ASG33_19705 [Dyadobacter sp. Leaf189]